MDEQRQMLWKKMRLSLTCNQQKIQAPMLPGPLHFLSKNAGVYKIEEQNDLLLQLVSCYECLCVSLLLRYRIQDARIPDAGCRDTRCRMPDAGYQMPDAPSTLDSSLTSSFCLGPSLCLEPRTLSLFGVIFISCHPR